MTEMFPRYGDQGDGVEYLQFQLANLGYDVGVVDGDYRDKTAAALAKFAKDYNGSLIDGKKLTARLKIYVDAAWSRTFGKPGPTGPPGAQGPRGEQGIQGIPGPPGKTPTKVLIEGLVVDAL